MTVIEAHIQQAGKANRWAVLFDGAECSNPAPIDFFDYGHSAFSLSTVGESEYKLHISISPVLATLTNFGYITVDGTCYGIAAGTVTVGIYTSPVAHSNYAGSDGYTDGLNQGRQMTIMEILPTTVAGKLFYEEIALFHVFSS